MKNGEKAIHGCCVILGKYGVLIRGVSGSGKSRLAHLLVEKYQTKGHYAQWVGDDRVLLELNAQAILARVPSSIAGKAERRFAGIEIIKNADAAKLDLIVDLKPLDELERLPEPKSEKLDKTSPPLRLIEVPQRSLQMAAELVFAQIALFDNY